MVCNKQGRINVFHQPKNAREQCLAAFSQFDRVSQRAVRKFQSVKYRAYFFHAALNGHSPVPITNIS